MDCNERMIKAQADRIAILNRDIREYKKKTDKILDAAFAEANHYKRAGTFYLKIQELLLKDENLMDEWRRFLVILRLSVDGLDEFFKD